jgi:dihydroorotate dehydrogenase (NAD+) catalytic subunit
MGLDISVKIKDVTISNPVMPAAGTFGTGRELSEFIDITKLGAVVIKGVSIEPWKGNPPPRIAEVPGGILNAVGLQNSGAEYFVENDLPYLRSACAGKTKIIVNVCGHSVSEYCAVMERLAQEDIDMFELNISCPNISKGGIAFGTDVRMVETIVRRVRSASKKPLIVKLSPNVTDISEIARVAESSGADGLSLINTISAMKIDIETRKPVLANITGGLSGPAVKSVAVRMVYQVANAVKIPVIGMGGISSSDDAIEFLLAGASAVAIGTANLNNPYAMLEVLDGIQAYMIKNDFKKLSDIRME